ncbi:MGDG synthase family glycosyltransferase [Alkalicoccobacillus murimartini]|uniref:Processive 1,2-diacylglycerol beta-glucosyltransferase n=1 Tax=Alkalicoccobacillus murimartini TaxID=171685 RepID=A0ABT9YK58_9BACI|nr:glycosyltransferase [Alkalicoccobacillus murimartini]MDQ0207901.1 processive 1,2-diacylglycerol beta-glucosyltransferase [Alkalicoccobacillus murimartini]
MRKWQVFIVDKDPLLFHMSIGYGHTKTAEILKKEVMRQTHYHPQLIDMLCLFPWWQQDLIRSSYYRLLQFAPTMWGRYYKKTATSPSVLFPSDFILKAMSSNLASILQNRHPPFIISTHPLVTKMIAIWKQELNITTPLYHVCTDFGFHQLALHPQVNGYFHSGFKVEVGHITKHPELFFPFGIPVEQEKKQHICKWNTRKKYGFSRNERILMIAGGGEGIAQYEEIIRALQFFPPLTILCMTGINNRVNQLQTEQNSGHTIHFIPFTKDFSMYVRLADVLITKAGGQTLAHAITTNTPLVLFRPIPGQEEENAYLLEERGAAFYARNSQELVEAVELLITNDSIRYERLTKAQKVSRPNSASRIIHQIVYEYHDCAAFCAPFDVKSIKEY